MNICYASLEHQCSAGFDKNEKHACMDYDYMDISEGLKVSVGNVHAVLSTERK